MSESLNRLPRKANAQTIESTIIYSIKSDNFDILLKEYHILAQRTLGILGARIRFLGDRISDLMVTTVQERLAGIIRFLAYHELQKISRDNQPILVPVKLTQEQLAAMTGSTQPTISELLKIMEQDGIIRQIKKQIIILDADKLKKLIKEN